MRTEVLKKKLDIAIKGFNEIRIDIAAPQLKYFVEKILKEIEETE